MRRLRATRERPRGAAVVRCLRAAKRTPQVQQDPDTTKSKTSRPPTRKCRNHPCLKNQRSRIKRNRGCCWLRYFCGLNYLLKSEKQRSFVESVEFAWIWVRTSAPLSTSCKRFGQISLCISVFLHVKLLSHRVVVIVIKWHLYVFGTK